MLLRKSTVEPLEPQNATIVPFFYVRQQRIPISLNDPTTVKFVNATVQPLWTEPRTFPTVCLPRPEHTSK